MADCEVLVVGAGLTGLSCAVFLAHHGVRCTVVERHPDLLSHPRQRSLAPRTLELYRQVGLAERIEAARLDFAGPADFVAVRAADLASPVYEQLETHDDPDRTAAASPCAGTPIDQDVVERLLRDQARELGARVRFGVELCDLDQDHDAVRARLRGPDGVDRWLRCRYLVAADGAQSPLRARLGIPMRGPGDFFHLLTLMVDADLRPALAGRTVHMAYLDRPRPRTFLMALDQAGSRWVFGTTDDPGSPEPDHAACVVLVRSAAGLPTVPVRLRPQIAGGTQVAMRFQVGAAVADRYRDGRVFLIGDAAHLMPPTGGFGGATGVQDAHNLAWKIAAELRGGAADALLDTYEAERRPVAEFTVRQALVRSRYRFAAADGAAEDGALENGVADNGGGAFPAPDEPSVDRATVMLGYRYLSTAVLGGAPGPSVPTAATALSGEPGTRAPHVPVDGGGSTLDRYGRGFVLLAGPLGGDWVDAARAVPGAATAGSAHRIDAATCPADTAVRHGIGPRGAVLVRPDGFVAWRSTGPHAEPAAELSRVLGTILGGRPERPSRVAAHAGHGDPGV
ncbi:MAG: FAD-dependent oxidoreductase [Actinocatenispora sp.]